MRGWEGAAGDLQPAQFLLIGAEVKTLHYESLQHVSISFGIVRAVLSIASSEGDYSFSTLSKDAAKKALTVMRSMMRKTSDTAAFDDLIVQEGDGVSSTAILLLKALNELNVLTDDKYRQKLRGSISRAPPRAVAPAAPSRDKEIPSEPVDS